jgi:Restriction endonuclease XhoI
MAGPSTILFDLPRYVREAVRFYWQTRTKQLEKQAGSGAKDQGLRSAVTGGAQMDGFIELLTKLVIEAGVDRSHIFYQESLELPGYFRPTKQWDFLVVVKGQLVAALEAKSQVGPSFGNNFNNRTEEAMGSALDLWTAFREKAFGTGVRPWLGYMFLLDDCPKSRAAVAVKEPHFKVFEDFGIPPTPSATNSSAAALSSSGTTTPPRFSSLARRPGSRATTSSQPRT